MWYLLKMMIFHSYVQFPEGIQRISATSRWGWRKGQGLGRCWWWLFSNGEGHGQRRMQRSDLSKIWPKDSSQSWRFIPGKTMENMYRCGMDVFFKNYFVFSELSQHCFKRKSAVEIPRNLGINMFPNPWNSVVGGEPPLRIPKSVAIARCCLMIHDPDISGNGGDTSLKRLKRTSLIENDDRASISCRGTLGYVPIWSDLARGSISSLAQLVLVAEWGMKIRLQSDSHLGNLWLPCFSANNLGP